MRYGSVFALSARASANVDHDFVQPPMLPRDAGARSAGEERREDFVVASEDAPAAGHEEGVEEPEATAEAVTEQQQLTATTC